MGKGAGRPDPANWLRDGDSSYLWNAQSGDCMDSAVRIAGFILAAVIGVAVIGYLAMLRPDIPYARLEAKYANTASRFVDLPGGVHLHYRDQGNPSGPPVVMIHGFSASLHAWEPWVARLGRDYRIITLDLPGHGLTRAPAGYDPAIGAYADLVDDFARRLGLGQFHGRRGGLGRRVATSRRCARPGPGGRRGMA
jgi:hypothetical protein